MEYNWSRAFADGREEALMGAGAGKLLDALVIHSPRGLLSGCRPADPSLTQVQAISDWAAQRKPYPPYVFFELDAAGQSFLLQIYGNEGRPCRSVPSEKIPCVDLVFHIVQLAAVTVGYDHIGILLEFFNIIHDR